MSVYLIDQQKRITKAKPFFKWFDIWVGVYVDKEHSAVYICPLPCVGLKIWREDAACCPVCPVCPVCHKTAKKTAHNTGDGWALSWECETKDCYFAYDVIEEIERPGGAWL